MKPLRERIRTPSCPVTFYELLPPGQEPNRASLEAYVECAAELVASTSIPIDAINVPEIHDEHRNDRRPQPYRPKADPREFARRLKATIDRPLELVINRCTVYERWATQQVWLEQTCKTFGLEHLVLVGGETSQVRYPGPSVVEMARSIRYVYDQLFFCGGVTIPTRRCLPPQLDEPARLVEKARHGLEFFTSQVLYEPHSPQRLLKDYDRLCRDRGLAPKRIFLSFAPAASRKDLDFLKWLGVDIPAAVERVLLKTNLGIGWRSLQIAKAILQDILAFVRAEGLRVPLGLNVEHITRRNFEFSKEFLEQLGALYASPAEKEAA